MFVDRICVYVCVCVGGGSLCLLTEYVCMCVCGGALCLLTEYVCMCVNRTQNTLCTC